jgi:hypothetical protein
MSMIDGSVNATVANASRFRSPPDNFEIVVDAHRSIFSNLIISQMCARRLLSVNVKDGIRSIAYSLERKVFLKKVS